MWPEKLCFIQFTCFTFIGNNVTGQWLKRQTKHPHLLSDVPHFEVYIPTINKGSLFDTEDMAGDKHSGAEDFSNNVVNHLADKFKQKFHKHIKGNPRALYPVKTEDTLA